jgi:hypothetical protein
MKDTVYKVSLPNIISFQLTQCPTDQEPQLQMQNPLIFVMFI